MHEGEGVADAWNTSGLGIQVDLEYKWTWNTSGPGIQVDLEYKWTWNTSGLGISTDPLPLVNLAIEQARKSLR
jgi:hypothetical protein